MAERRPLALDGPSDAELVADYLRTRADAAFMVLHQRYVDRVYRRSLSFCRDPATAEDLTQEIFVKVFLSLDRYRGDAAFATWLYRVATNHCLNFLRDRKEFAALDDDAESAAAWRSAPKTPPTGLSETLESLPRASQALLLLKFRDGYTYEEIARRTGLSESAVKMRISRARSLLKASRRREGASR